MPFSRNLGSVTIDNLADMARAATHVTTVDMVKREFLETSQLDEDDQKVLTDAVDMAHAGLVALGGAGDVHLGGQVTIQPDGSTQRSITATVTVTTPKA